MKQTLNRIQSMPTHQAGIVAILTTVALLGIVAILALSIESGRMFMNKTGLQNAVDAAALTAAREFMLTEEATAARAAAIATFNEHVNADGNQLLQVELTEDNFLLEFLTSLTPATTVDPDTTTEKIRFFRVVITDVNIKGLLSSILGVDSYDVGAAAVAGPSPALVAQACGVTPILVCSDPSDTDGAGPENGFFGYDSTDDAIVLKFASDKAGNNNSQDSSDENTLGAGNFHLLDFGADGGGANAVKEELAQGIDGCVSSNDIAKTQPGIASGPVSFGINSRFDGAASGGSIDSLNLLPDIVAVNPSLQNGSSETNYTPYSVDNLDKNGAYTYEQYQNDQATCLLNPESSLCAENGTVGRRVISVVMGQCSDEGGSVEVSMLGFGCFFLPQSITLQGNEGDVELFGEFVEGCSTIGGFSSQSPVTESEYEPKDLILYKDPTATDA